MTPADKTAVRRHRLILLALWVLFYASFTLFSPPLLDDADSVHAEVAREMLLRHDYVTLYANGIRYLEKAPLYYWATAAAFKLFGPTTAAARLPLATSVLALAMLLEAFARRAFANRRAGLYAGLITLSSFGIFIFSRINIPDVLVCVLLTAALFCFWLVEAAGALRLASATPAASDRPRTKSTRTLCVLFAAALALNVLTKGLIGIVFPLAIVLFYLLATRGLRGTLTGLRRLHPLLGTLVFFAIAAPWHILIALANPGHGHPAPIARVDGHWQVPLPTDGNVHGWAWFYFINEQLYRYLNLRVPHDYDTSPLWLFYGLLFIWLMPWSAYLPGAIRRAWPSTSRFRLRVDTQAERNDLLFLIWLAIPLLFFSLSTRQEYYVLPALPPMILLIAGFLASAPPEPPLVTASGSRFPFRVHSPSAALLIAGTVLATAILYFLLHTQAPAPSTDLATLLQQNPADYALSFGHFLDLNAQALGLFRLPLALTAFAFFCGPLANLLLRRQGRPHAATLALAAASFLFLFASWIGLVTFSPTLTSHQLAESIAPQLNPQDLLVIHGEYEAGSTLGFYLHQRDIHILEGRSSNLWYGSFFPDAPHIFETRQSIAQKWRSRQRIFLWQDPSDHDRPALTAADLGAPVYVIASSDGKQILSNQPVSP